MTTAPLQQLGDYELLHELKSGGMGSVYLARKRGTGGFEKLLAIKTIRRELSSRTDLRTMFLDEAQLLSRLDHPAIAQVYDFGEQGKTLFLAMEYVGGISFSDLVEVPPSVVVRLLAQVCRALHAAHELKDLQGHAMQIVHRDVSPDNLMLSFDGHVKVLDFGIALMRGRQAPVTEYGTIKGKPPYLSPEQVKGRRVDRRADIWATGVVLWEQLTGKRLFRGDSIFAIALAVDEQEILRPSLLAGQLPHGLDPLVLRALERNPDARFQTALELAEALEGIADSIAAPSLQEYAEAALRSQQEQHRVWLLEVLGGRDLPAQPGRATGLHTIPAQATEATELADVEDVEIPEAAAQVFPPIAAQPARKRRMRMALASLVPLGLIVWVTTSTPSPAPSSTITLAEATFDAGLKALQPASDANQGSDAQVLSDARAPIVPLDAHKRTPQTPRRTTHAPMKDAATAKAPVPAAGVGTITIAAEPYALVRVDGKEIGTTPLFNKQFSAGSHVIELIHPNSGEVRLRRSIILKAGAHKSVIDR